MKRLVVGGAVLALGVAGMSMSQAAGGSGYKVTGGGQIIANGQGGGAGDTVGFVAQATDANGGAQGQFQYVPRGQNTNGSAPTDKFHGVVTCLSSTGANSARFGGYYRDNPGQAFTVDVTDNGEGASAAGADMILVRDTQSPCAAQEQGDTLFDLGRGNVQIHNAQ